MAFTSTLVVLIIYHQLLTGSNSVELSWEYLTDGERLKTFQRGHENNEHYQRRINLQVHLVYQYLTNYSIKQILKAQSLRLISDNGCVSKPKLVNCRSNVRHKQLKAS